MPEETKTAAQRQLENARALVARLEEAVAAEQTAKESPPSDEEKELATEAHDATCMAPNHVGGECDFALQHDWAGPSRQRYLRIARRLASRLGPAAQRLAAQQGVGR
jgi:hypothetical protein